MVGRPAKAAKTLQVFNHDRQFGTQAEIGITLRSRAINGDLQQVQAGIDDGAALFFAQQRAVADHFNPAAEGLNALDHLR